MPESVLVLDEGGAPIFVPPDAGRISIASDGTISADGRPFGRLGVVIPSDPTSLQRQGDTLFSAEGGFEPVESPRILQGFVEGSNVNPVMEMTRMIEVQRNYELGQSFSDRESKRLSSLIDTLSR